MSQRLAENSKSLRIMLTAGCVVVMIWALKMSQPFLAPVVVAFFLAQLAAPVMKGMRKNRVPLPLAVAFTVMLNILIVVGFVVVSVNLITDFQPQVRDYIAALLARGDEYALHLQEVRNMEDAVSYWKDFSRPGAEAIVRFVGGTDIIGRVIALFSTAFFILLLMVFMLLEGGKFTGRIAAIRRLHGPNFAHLGTVSKDIQKYLGVKTLVSAATGTLAGGLCALLGVEGALLWGLVAFILNFIPAIGSVVAAVPPVLIRLAEGEPFLATMVLTGYIIINIIFGNFLEPLLLGRRFGVSTLVILISVLFWGWLWGPLGMFLAVPLTMLVKVVLDNTEDFEWISVAMGKSGIKPLKVKSGEPVVALHEQEP